VKAASAGADLGEIPQIMTN